MQVPSFVQRTPFMKVVFRDNAIASLAEELGLLGMRRPLFLTNRSARLSTSYQTVICELKKLDVLVADDIPAHSSVPLTELLTAQAKEHSADGIVVFGGGSVSDSAKAIAVLLAEGGSLQDHQTTFTPPSTLRSPLLVKPKIPIVAIPCTASGAEVTSTFGVRAPDGRKLLFTDVQVASRLVLLDPVANIEVPQKLMLSTAMNAFAHCLEGLYSLERAPLAEIVALDAINRLAKVMPAVKADPTNKDHRGQLLYAAHLSGLVLVNARTCLHHAVCHAIGSVTGVGHGDSNSVMLPHAIEFNSKEVKSALNAAAEAYSGTRAQAAPIAESIKDLQKLLGVPTRLRDIGVSESVLPVIAKKTMGERGLYYNPRKVDSYEQILGLLEAAY